MPIVYSEIDETVQCVESDVGVDLVLKESDEDHDKKEADEVAEDLCEQLHDEENIVSQKIVPRINEVRDFLFLTFFHKMF